MTSRRVVLATLAAGVVGAVLPAGPASAAVVPAKPAFGGFSVSATATPLKIEVYEPTIPIPASPQAEASFAYTKVESATGPNAAGRASWLWPGDPVGEGWKTFVEQLGLPEQLAQGGYRVQVNSQTPGGPESQADEPFPGTVMRTSASAKETVAKAGYSTAGDVSDQDPKGGSGGAPGVPGVPAVPGPPGAPAPGDLSALGAAITGKQAAAAGAPGAPSPTPPSPALPPQLAALVDVGGMTSISKATTAGGVVSTSAASRVTDLSLLSGLVTADSVKVVSASSSNGRKGVSDGSARVVGLALAGNAFVLDRDGVHAVGKQTPIPGLPQDPAKALHALGISFVLPKGQRAVQGADAQTALQGLQIVIETQKLRSRLDQIPFDEIVNQVPDQAGQLKSLLGAAVHLAPRLVITAGGAQTAASTVPAIKLPSLGALPGAATSSGGGAATGGPVTGAGGALPAPAGGIPSATSAGSIAPTTSVATRNAAAGLPPLASVPGALMVGGLLLASGLGWWLQKVGGFVIGGAGSCSHGLETGVPDLRKA